MGTTYDMNGGITDRSKRPPVAPANTESGTRMLSPIFAAQGLSNTLMKINSASDFLTEFGAIDNMKVYGQQGVQTLLALQNGGTAYVCRLMPSDAKTASSVLAVKVKTVEGQKFAVDENGHYEKDADGNKIPVTLTDGTPVMTNYVEIDWKVQPATIVYDSKKGGNPSAFDIQKISNESNIIIDNEEYTPIMLLMGNTLGTCSNKVKFNLTNGSVDKRREKYRTYNFSAVYEDPAYGNISITDHVSSSALEFSFSEMATVSAKNSTSVNFASVWKNGNYISKYDRNDSLPNKVQVCTFVNNYEEIMQQIKDLNSEIDTDNLDILFGYTKDGYEHTEMVFAAESFRFGDFKNSYIALAGGSNGSLQRPNAETKAAFYAKQKELLISFFNFGIDIRLGDVAKIDVRFLFAANYEDEIIRAMLQFGIARPEVMIFLDTISNYTPNNIINFTNSIYQMLPANMPNVAVMGGLCSPIDYKDTVTLTYEMAGLLYKTYSKKRFGTFFGPHNGTVNFINNYYGEPIVYSDDNNDKGEDVLYKEAGLNWLQGASEIYSRGVAADRNPDASKLYIANNHTVYNDNSSVLKQIQNVAICCDIQAHIKLLSQTNAYRFNAEDAIAHMGKAATTLLTGGRYPLDILVKATAKAYQTEADITNKKVTIEYELWFANVIESFTNKITVDNIDNGGA